MLTTPPRNSFVSGNKISGLETNKFGLKVMVKTQKSGLEFFYFEILPAPSELLLPK